MTSASMMSSACIQSSDEAWPDAVVERVRLALAALLPAQVHDRSGYWAALARTTSGVSSVLASSTTKTRSASGGYSRLHQPVDARRR